jgi:OOP family OmpA-OmpF porin
MQSITKLIIAAFVVMGLGACVGTTLDQAQSTASSGDEFSSALNKYYLQRAAHEYGYGNYESSDWFASRAIQAANGEAVAPQSPSERMLPSNLEGMMGSSYDRLNAALDGTADTAGAGRDMAPDAAARAQVMFECWMEEGHEGRQPDHIAFCKDEFFAALQEVEAAIEPEAVVMIMEEEVDAIEFLVYFDLSDASIRSDQQATMDVVIAAAQSATDRSILIVGHTDTSGAVDYNQALSERRTISVITQMLEGGIDRSRITSEAVGQTQPLVDTGDDVREQANRVAVITLLP